MGRGFVAEDTAGPEVMLISDALWSRRFGRDPQILGRQLRIRGSLRTVVGIMPADFREPELGGRIPPEMWRVLHTRDLETERRSDFLRVIARMKPGVSVEQARADIKKLPTKAAAAA